MLAKMFLVSQPSHLPRRNKESDQDLVVECATTNEGGRDMPERPRLASLGVHKERAEKQPKIIW